MAVGDKRPGARYDVLLDRGRKRGHVCIGHVEKCSDKSYRSEGTGSRILYGFRGYSVTWRGQLANDIFGRDVVIAYSRKVAVARLLETWRKRKGARR